MEVVKMKIKKSVLLEALKVLRKVVVQTSSVEVVRSVRRGWRMAAAHGD